LPSKHSAESSPRDGEVRSNVNRTSRLGVFGRVHGTGSVARGFVLPLWLTAAALVLLVPPTSFTRFDALARWFWIAACTWFIVRSVFVGVYVNQTKVVVVGWFWVHRFSRAEIDAFLTKTYDGLITRGSDRNIFSSRVRSLGISIAFDRIHYFNSIAMPNAISKRVVEDLGRLALVPLTELPRTRFDRQPPSEQPGR